jgi:hypothetical protein
MQSLRKFRLSLIAASALVAVPFTAAQAAADLDGYWIPYSSAKVGSGDDALDFDDGDGWGVKGKFGLSDLFFLSGEYEKNKFDDIGLDGGFLGSSIDSDLRTEQYRGGLGFRFPETPFYTYGEYIGFESKVKTRTTGPLGSVTVTRENDKAEGWGGHLGAQGKVLNDKLTLTTEIGYVDIGDVDGLEVLAGGAVEIVKHFSIFADYRYTSLAGGNDPDVRLEEARLGARFSF